MQRSTLNAQLSTLKARVVATVAAGFAVMCFGVITPSHAADTAAPPTTGPVYTLPRDQVKFAKGYPVIPPEIKAADDARQREWDRLDDEAWHKAESIVARGNL